MGVWPCHLSECRAQRRDDELLVPAWRMGVTRGSLGSQVELDPHLALDARSCDFSRGGLKGGEGGTLGGDLVLLLLIHRWLKNNFVDINRHHEPRLTAHLFLQLRGPQRSLHHAKLEGSLSAITHSNMRNSHAATDCSWVSSLRRDMHDRHKAYEFLTRSPAFLARSAPGLEHILMCSRPSRRMKVVWQLWRDSIATMGGMQLDLTSLIFTFLEFEFIFNLFRLQQPNSEKAQCYVVKIEGRNSSTLSFFLFVSSILNRLFILYVK